MGKYFRFLSYLGLASVCNGLYGTPYPSLNKIRVYLDSRGGTGKVVTKAFEDVYAGAKESDFGDLELIGEENGTLILPEMLALLSYKPEDYRDWQWQFDTIYGFFSCTVQGMSVFNGETIRKAVETAEEERLKKLLTRSDTKRIAELTKVCRVLLSEEFAKRLMTEPLLKALYDNKDAAYSCFDVEFSPHVSEENIFRFDVMYSQTIKDEERQAKAASRFAVRFHFGYDLAKQAVGGKLWNDIGKCFVPYQPQLECLDVDGEEICANLFNFDERKMDRVWQHPYWESVMCEGKEKILREKKKAVAEAEKHENSEKSKEGLGLKEEIEKDWSDVFEKEEQKNSEKSEEGLELEEDAEDLKVHAEEHKKDKALELRDPNKRPRSPDSEIEPEDNFKKKKE